MEDKKMTDEEREELLKAHSKSFKVWWYFKNLFTYFLSGIVMTALLINFVNGIIYSFTTDRWWVELIVMGSVGVVSAICWFVNYKVKKSAQKIVDEVTNNDKSE